MFVILEENWFLIHNIKKKNAGINQRFLFCLFGR